MISTILAYERTRSYLVIHALQNFQVWVIDTAIIIQALKCQKVNLGESAATGCEKKYVYKTLLKTTEIIFTPTVDSANNSRRKYSQKQVKYFDQPDPENHKVKEPKNFTAQAERDSETNRSTTDL